MRSRHLLALIVALLCATAHARTGEHPNLLLIVSDDQQPDAIGAFGRVPVVTPALDSLVARGKTFRRAYCMGSFSAAVCAPSRAMLLTGDTVHQLPPGPYNLAGPDRSWWPERLRERGYQTFGTGKWHNGRAAFQRCFSDGGAIFFGGMGSHRDLMVHDYDPTGTYPNGARRRLAAFSSTEFADAALSFLERRDEERPFFLYLSFTAPHDPRTPPQADRALYDPAHIPLPPGYLPEHPFDNGELVVRDERLAPWPRTPEVIREHLADYYGMITHMDRQIGRVLERLEAKGLLEDTIIAFVSDHGLAIGRHGLLGKQNLYEHSIGAPLIFAGPGIPRGETTQALCYVADVLPTLLDLAGVEPGRESFFRSLRPALEGASGRESIVTCYRTFQRAICDGRWKLIRYPDIHRTQLFDLEADPHETNDLAGSPAARSIEERLLASLVAECAALGDPLPLVAAPRREAARPAFAPPLFVFQNGVDFGTSDEEAKTIRDLGYDGVGSVRTEGLAERMDALGACGLRVFSIYVELGDEAIEGAIELLRGSGATIELTIRRPLEPRTVRELQDLADLAQDAGLRIALYPHAGFTVQRIDDALDLIERADRPNVGLMFNLCHYLMGEDAADLEATVQRAGPKTFAASICGADTEGGTWAELIRPLDEGTFAPQRFLRALDAAGFQGAVGLQCYAVKGDKRENLRRSMAAWERALRSMAAR